LHVRAGAALHAAGFSGAALTSLASITPAHQTSELLLAFGGRLLVSVSQAAGNAATYDVAPDLVTLTPNDTEPVAPGSGAGVLLPCPDL
jgi:hypothetical protein